VERFATFALLLLATGLVVQLIANGPAGGKRWLKAKFLGRP
jgi:hypothetical protein